MFVVFAHNTRVYLYKSTSYAKKNSTMNEVVPGYGALGSKTAIKVATWYAAFQSMFIVGCITTQYRLMVYHVDFVHIDLSKVMPLTKIWNIFIQSTRVEPNVQNTTIHTNMDAASKLDQLLHTYKVDHTAAIRVYKVRTIYNSLNPQYTLPPRPQKARSPFPPFPFSYKGVFSARDGSGGGDARNQVELERVKHRPVQIAPLFISQPP